MYAISKTPHRLSSKTLSDEHLIIYCYRGIPLEYKLCYYTKHFLSNHVHSQDIYVCSEVKKYDFIIEACLLILQLKENSNKGLQNFRQNLFIKNRLKEMLICEDIFFYSSSN